MREQILSEIRRLAEANGGRAPGRAFFEKETGIRVSDWYGRYWARWGDALAEAGLSANKLQRRLDEAFVLEKLVEAFRHFGRVPTDGEIRMYGRATPDFPSHSTIHNHFRNKAAMLARLREWASSEDGYADVVAMLPEEATRAAANRERTPSEGLVYLLRSGAHYKIGRSEELERRVKEITIALPETVTLIHAIRTDDPSGIEAYWHRRFAERRANGEWFKLTPSDVAAFKRRKFQ